MDGSLEDVLAAAQRIANEKPKPGCFFCRCKRIGVICRCLGARITGRPCPDCGVVPWR